MYKYITAFILIACLNSCSYYQLSPLSSSYKANPVISRNVSGISQDEVWNRIIRFFADHDLPIKMVDKNSGFIQSDILSFVSAYQIDSDSTALFSPPYVIVQREEAYDSIIQPSYITGYLKLFVLPANNATHVRVSIEDLKSFHVIDFHHKHSTTVTHDEILRSVVSTTAFENQISQYIETGHDTTHIAISKGEILNPKNNYAAYLKKNSNRFLTALIGGLLGGYAVVIGTTVLIVESRKQSR